MPLGRLFVLWHCTRSLDRCLLFNLTFLYLSYLLRPIITLFTYFTLHFFLFHIFNFTRNIFLVPDGPHSSNILLSNVSSFVDTMEFTMKHIRVNLLQFINRVSSHVFVEVARYSFSVATSSIFESLILKQFDLYGKTITHVLHLE